MNKDSVPITINTDGKSKKPVKPYTINKERKIIYVDYSLKLSETKKAKVDKEIQMYLTAGYELRAKVKRVLSEELQAQNRMKHEELVKMLEDRGEKALLKFYHEQKENGVKYFVIRKTILDQLWYKDTLSEVEDKLPERSAEFRRIFESEGKKVAQAYYEEIKAKTPAKSEAKK